MAEPSVTVAAPPCGPQVAVPDHLGERDRHEEAAALRGKGPERHLAPGEVEPRVLRAVVVADDQERLARGRDVVLVLAVVELSAHAELDRAEPELHARPELEAVAGLVDRAGRVRDAPGPLVAAERVAGEAVGLFLFLLVDGVRVLGRGGSGKSERKRRGGEGDTCHGRHSSRVGLAWTRGRLCLAA